MEKSHMQKQRKLKRRHLIYYLRVFDRASNALIGHLVDITPEGMMLLSEEPLTVRRQYALRMLLPVEIFGREQLDFDATCLWSKPDVNPSFMSSGLKLASVDSTDIETIEDMIVQYGFRD